MDASLLNPAYWLCKNSTTCLCQEVQHGLPVGQAGWPSWLLTGCGVGSHQIHPTSPRSSWLLWYCLQTSSTSILQTLATQVTEASHSVGCMIRPVPGLSKAATLSISRGFAGLARIREIKCIQRREKSRGVSLEIRASSLIRALTGFLFWVKSKPFLWKPHICVCHLSCLLECIAHSMSLFMWGQEWLQTLR